MGATYVTEPRYQARILDATNQVTALYTDFVEISYKKIVNEVGLCLVTVPVDHPIVETLEDDLLLAIYIAYQDVPQAMSKYGLKWVLDFAGLYRDKQVTTDQYGNVYYILYFRHLNDVFSRAIINWPAGTLGKNYWIGEALATIANDIVRWNLTADATVANGRNRDISVVRGLHDAGSISGTDIVDYSIGYRNVLEVLQELAPICGFDFEVRFYDLSPGTLEAKQWTGQQGIDRSADVIFDLALDNIASANINGDRLRERTVAVVGGPGEGAARVVSLRTGANYSATNDYEFFIDARDRTTAELPTIGDAKLGEFQARVQYDFDLAPSLGYVYPRDVGLGDLVTGRLAGVSATRKIKSVAVSFRRSDIADINLELVEP